MALTCESFHIPQYVSGYAKSLPLTPSVSSSLSYDSDGPIYPPSDLSTSPVSTPSEDSEWRLQHLGWFSQASVYGVVTNESSPTPISIELRQSAQSTPFGQVNGSVEAVISTPVTTKPKSKRKLSQQSTASVEPLPVKRGRGRPRKVVAMSSSLPVPAIDLGVSPSLPISTSLPITPTTTNLVETSVADASSPHSSLLVSISMGSDSSVASSRGSVQQIEDPLVIARSRFWSIDSMISTKSLPAIGSILF